MKRKFLAFVILATLSFTVTPSHALLGTNDSVVGYDILVPFFLVSMTGHGNLDTVIVLTETARASSTSTFAYDLYTKSSVYVFDSAVSLTVGDVATLSASSIVDACTAEDRTALEYDLDGDGTNDHYVGYMVFENPNTSTPINHIMASAYLIDLQNGISAGMNLPVREVNESKNITDGNLINLTRYTEYFSANALYRAQRYIAGQSVVNPTHFRLTPRFYIGDSSSHNYFFIWASTNCPALHVNFYDTEENYMSTTLPALNTGLNILDIDNSIPNGLFPTYPKVGWVDMAMPDLGGFGFEGSREMLGYSFQTKTVPPGICGDVSDDAQVNISDAMFIAQFLAGNRSCICTGTPREQCDSSSQTATSSGYISLTEMYRDAY